MKAHFNRQSLLAAAQLAAAAATNRDVKPILRCLKIVCSEEACTVTGTDLEIGLRAAIKGYKVSEPGNMVVPFARLLPILRELEEEQIWIETSGSNVFLTGSRAEFELPSESAEEFPDVPSLEGDCYHEFQADVLRGLIRQTVFAAATDNPRYAVTGCLLELVGDKATLVATDGRRLAVATGAAVAKGGHTTEGSTHVVPTKGMKLADQLLDGEEMARVLMRPNDTIIQTGRATLFSRLLDGRYPAYREVFPKKHSMLVPLETEQFSRALRQAAVMLNDQTRRIDFTFAKGKLTLKAAASDVGKAKVEMPLAHDGKELSISFDPKFILDGLKVVDGDVWRVELLDGKSPALFRAGANDSFQYVVMPLS